MSRSAQDVRHFWLSLFLMTDHYRESIVKMGKERKKYEILAITIKQARVLKSVRLLTLTQKEGITLKTLSQALDVTAGTASEIVETLVKRGELVRVVSPTDRRAVLISLSPKAKRIMAQHQRAFDSLTLEFLNTFSEEEQESMMNVVRKFEHFLRDKGKWRTDS